MENLSPTIDSRLWLLHACNDWQERHNVHREIADREVISGLTGPTGLSDDAASLYVEIYPDASDTVPLAA